MTVRRRTLLSVSAIALIVNPAMSDQVIVRHTEGLVHGFLILRTLDGTRKADGELIQTASGSQVTSRLIFHFDDGSVSDETTIFSQQQTLRLLSDHLEQKGRSFPPLDLSIDAISGQVTVKYTDDHGLQRSETAHMNLPADLANGLIVPLLTNAQPNSPPRSVGFLAATPKPRLVRLKITPAGEEPFSTGQVQRTAMHYVVKVELGGIAGAVAPLIGKQPPDAHVWILGGDAPVLVKAEQPLYSGGPVWRIELQSPVWPPVSAK